MPNVPKTRVLPEIGTIPKVFVAILAGSGIALVVAQVLGLFLHS